MDRVARLNYDELNSTLRYAMWSVFRTDPARLPEDRAALGDELAGVLEQADGNLAFRPPRQGEATGHHHFPQLQGPGALLRQTLWKTCAEHGLTPWRNQWKRFP